MKKIDIDGVLEDLNVQSIQTGLTFAANAAKSDRSKQALGAIGAAITVGKFILDHYNSYRDNKGFDIKIFESDALFNKVQTWLLDTIPANQQKSIMVTSRSASSGSTSDEIREVITRHKPKITDFLNIFYDGERTQKINFEGSIIEITLGSENAQEGRASSNSMKTTNTRYVTITCPTIKSRDEVLLMLKDESKKFYKRRPTFWVAQKWGNFKRTSDIPVRTAESVILAEGQKERILDQLQKFLSQEKEYVELGIPWHTGLLLYGPPGSGKTSIATAIAHTLNLDVHFISLSAVDDDSALVELLGDVSARSILLLEDIDVARSTKERDDSTPGVTLSGLLNGLDGLATPHGIITIMTTNHFEALDPALVRPGRVDLLEEIGYVDTQQIKELCEQFMGYVPQDLPTVQRSDRIVASQIIEVFKNNIEDMSKAGSELVTVLSNKVLEALEDDQCVTPKAKQAKASTKK